MSLNEISESSESTVARIDERTKSIQTELVRIADDIKTNNDAILDRVKETEKRHSDQISDALEKHDDLARKVETEYVKVTDFALIQKIVYGFVGIIVMSVVAAVLATVIIQPAKTVTTPVPIVTTK